MTFIGALTAERFGVLWTDTRQMVGGEFFDGLAPKLRQLHPEVFAAGSGWNGFTDLALDVVAERLADDDDLRHVGEAVKAVADSWVIREAVASMTDNDRAQLETWAAARQGRGRFGKVVVVHRTGQGFGCFSVDDTGTLEPHPRGQLFTTLPPGLSPSAFRPHALAIWGAGPRGREAVLRAAAATIRSVAGLTRYSSAALEAVYLTPGRAMRVGPVPAESFLEVAA